MSERAIVIDPETHIAGSFEPTCGFLELNLGHSLEQYVLLTHELFL